ncbi:hypothetical protein VT84_33100 [Gemmata sp. SH-PL17]|uniref:hypothetical protein n=1 Tax=Gemmata sp. SH-PL17 TaxID=1630693 RepID=UPI00078E0F17|nr:hypothetical protein [Gemmata sp. SH-PL17]AMV29280.1 hypothetical protein VT84_33100 [Gemmata sp. SH-PL17]
MFPDTSTVLNAPPGDASAPPIFRVAPVPTFNPVEASTTTVVALVRERICTYRRVMDALPPSMQIPLPTQFAGKFALALVMVVVALVTASVTAIWGAACWE